MTTALPVVIATIAMNAAHHLRYRAREIAALRNVYPGRIAWAIATGPSYPVADTSWCREYPLKYLAPDARSIDDTESVSQEMADVWNPSPSWPGKAAQINHAVEQGRRHLEITADQPHVILQMDADESWSPHALAGLCVSLSDPRLGEMGVAVRCNYWISPKHAILCAGHHCWGNHHYEWRRVAKLSTSRLFTSHEPPEFVDITWRPWPLVFNHYAYTRPIDMEIRQEYYGQAGLVEGFNRLVDEDPEFGDAHDYYPHIPPGTGFVRMGGAP